MKILLYKIDREVFDERREAVLSLALKGLKVNVPNFSEFESRVAHFYELHCSLPASTRPRFPKIVTEKALAKWHREMTRSRK